MQFVIELFNQYGYVVLLIALMLELIAFPLPGEALMTYCGYLIYQHKMNLALSILIAFLGVISGITLAYFIGKKLEMAFFEKHGHYVHMDKKRLDNISIWFKKYGNKLLIIAYFIPGVRHITGYFSGVTQISYKKFAINAYIGAFIWTATFISLGKVLGGNWEKYHGSLKRYLLIIVLIISVVLVCIYIYKRYRQRIFNYIFKLLNHGLKVFNSLGKIKAVIAIVAVFFIVFSALVVGIIQDYLAHEVSQFDEITSYLVGNIFNEDWSRIMNIFRNESNIYILLGVATATVIWIYLRGTEKFHEVNFLIISFLGAEFIGFVFKTAFHRLGPSEAVYTFPSSNTLMTVVVYGFLAYMVVRHSKKPWINSVVISISLAVSLLTGVALIYFNLEYPSDVVAGYEFGFLWLSLCIILLEVYRVLPTITEKE